MSLLCQGFFAGAPLLPEDQLFPLLQPGYYAPVEEPTKAPRQQAAQA